MAYPNQPTNQAVDGGSTFNALNARSQRLAGGANRVLDLSVQVVGLLHQLGMNATAKPAEPAGDVSTIGGGPFVPTALDILASTEDTLERVKHVLEDAIAELSYQNNS